MLNNQTEEWSLIANQSNFRILKINSENLDKKEKLLNSHLSSVKETKKKDKARQSSSGGSAPGTPVPGERGNVSGGSALTPGELKVIDCSFGDLFSIVSICFEISYCVLLEWKNYSFYFSRSQKSSKEKLVVATKVMVVPTVEIQVEHQLQFPIDLSRYEIQFFAL